MGLAKFWVSSFCLIILLIDVYGFERIIGGFETTVEKRPYLVSLQYFRPTRISHLCGASIISTKFLLSAAHCDPGVNLPILYARVGSTSYKEGGQVLKVAKFETHPDYEVSTLDYDFAIVSFEGNQVIALGTTARIVSLSSIEVPLYVDEMVVAGWGVMQDTSNVASEMMNEVELPLVDANTCRIIYDFLTDRQICLGGTRLGGTSACYGDSGGPAIHNGIQYGVVSGVLSGGCSAPNIPGLYAKVSSARPWIYNITSI